MQEDIIVIAAGHKLIEAASIPNWIAEKLEPIPDVPPVRCDVNKKFLIADNHWRVDDLMLSDGDLLDGIWRNLPPVLAADMHRSRTAG